MKVILKYTIAILCFFILSCNSDKTVEIPDIDENITACGVHQPHKNLPWLKKIVEKAETDRTGNYLGHIWLTKYMEQDIFVTDMGLGSGGVAYWIFDCNGDDPVIGKDELENMDFVNTLPKSALIYSNVPF